MAEVLERKFVKPTAISESLKCVICSDVFVEATRLFCSHTFCLECLNGLLKVKNSCPMCRNIIDKKNWGPDRIAQAIINDLEVFCSVDDCGWKGSNKNLEYHYDNECTMRQIAKLSGKTHKKQKVFNMNMLKSEEVQEKINQNMIKGCLEVRLELAMRKNGMRQNSKLTMNQDSKQIDHQLPKSNPKGTYDFLEQLFD